MIASEVQDEIEVLQAIHLDDFSSLPQVWHFPCFEIKINSYSEVFIKLRFTLNKGTQSQVKHIFMTIFH